nr:anti-sigma factor [Arthrobacter sp. PAMC25564]
MEPGSHNWHAIHQALGLSPSLAGDPLGQSAARARDARDFGEPSVNPAEAPTSLPLSSSAPPVPLPSGRRQPWARRGLWITGVAAGIVLGAAGAWTAASIFGRAEPPVAVPTPSAVVLAETPLKPLAAHAASGDAVVQRLPNGTRQLVIRLPDENVSGFREVWVGSADLSKMVSLGVLGNDPGVFVIPSGLDLAQYPVVDISNEPYDGDPAHSTESIARGRLTVPG